MTKTKRMRGAKRKTPRINRQMQPDLRSNTSHRARQRLFSYRLSTRWAGGGESRHELEVIKIHELAKLPEMSAKEYGELRDDIARNGLMEPIVLHEGKVLDGYHRSKVCCELGIPRKIVTYKGTDPAGYVLSRNAYRRHLTADQRTALITKLRGPQLKAEAQARIKAGKADPALKSAEGRVDEQIAKESGVGRDKARKAIHLLDTKPEVLDEVITGKRKGLPAEPAEPKPVTHPTTREYVNKRLGVMLKHWKSRADQQKVREVLLEILKG